MKSSKQELILTALLSCPTVREAAEASGVPETTIYNWLRRPEFKAEYDKRRRSLVDNAASYMQVKLSAAIKTVLGIMGDDTVPPQTRLNAARTVLEYCHKMIEQRDVLERLEALEAAQDDSGR